MLATSEFSDKSDIVQEKNLLFVLNKEEKTANIISNNVLDEDILIPESIIINSQKYIISSILEGSFAYMMNIKSIKFSDDSKLKFIDKYSFSFSSLETISIPSQVKEIDDYAFFNCEKLQKIEFSEPSQLNSIGNSVFVNTLIENICIPSNVIELKEGWCCSTCKLTNISIHPQNQNFSMIYKNIIVGKINSKSDIFDVLLFAPRNIRNVLIPSNIKRIESFAFDRCIHLEKVDFLKNSELTSIGRDAFSYSSFRKIVIPTGVDHIDMYSFFICKKLKCIEFCENCKIVSIGKFAFAHSEIKSFFIPSSIRQIGEGAFSFCNNLQIIETAENSELFSLNGIQFGYSTNVLVMIPIEGRMK